MWRGWGSMVWCGVVSCRVVWWGVVWCGVVWWGVVWCGVMWPLDHQCADDDGDSRADGAQGEARVRGGAAANRGCHQRHGWLDDPQ